MTDRCSASAQVAHEAIIFSYLLVMAWNIHEWTSEVILFQLQKNVNTHFFKFTDVNLLCTVWLVCWTKWQILHYDWSNCLSIKVPAKGQFQTENSMYNSEKSTHDYKKKHFKVKIIVSLFFYVNMWTWLLCTSFTTSYLHLTCWTLICAFAPSRG